MRRGFEQLYNQKGACMAKRQEGLSFYTRKKKVSPSVIREIFGILFGIFTAIFIAVVLTYFFGMTTNVVGDSMEPTVYNGQTIYVDRFAYMLATPERGDVIVFLPNGNKNTHYYVKRVIAVPGDVVVIKNGICYVNGEESDYVTVKILDAGIMENEVTLGSGEYFCLGDAPNSGEDSRSANIGMVKLADIKGRAWLHLKCEQDTIGFIA